MNDFTRMKYIQKLRTADQVAGMVSSGDRIFFGEFVLRPDTLDEALARRAKQLSNVIIEGVCITTVPRFIEADFVGSTSSIMTGTSQAWGGSSTSRDCAAMSPSPITRGLGS